MKLSEAIEALCVATRANGRSPRTVDAYREKLSHLAVYLKDPPIESITVHDLRSFVVSQMEKTTLYQNHPTRDPEAGSLSPFTVSSRVRHIKRLFNWLEDEGILDNNPARRLKVPKPKRERPKGVNYDDVVALAESIDGNQPADLRDKAMVLFLADTGCRVGGMCGLQVEDLDVQTCTAHVTEKDGRPRPLFFTPGTAEALQAWLQARPEDRGPWVFIGLGNRSSGALKPESVARILRHRAKDIGIEGPVNPHAFRHGFAREFLLRGGNLATLADILGHSNVQTTKDFYGVFTAEQLRREHSQYSPLAARESDNDDP